MMPFFIKTLGGPLDGQTRACDDLSKWGLEWPLPDELPYPLSSGTYIKVAESRLPVEAASHPNVGLGVTYEWVQG